MKRPSTTRYVSKRPSSRFIPKRGLARMVICKPAVRKHGFGWVNYTRIARPSANLQRNMKAMVNVRDFLKGTKWTTNHLLSLGFLKVPDVCDVCGTRRWAFHHGKRHGDRSQSRCSNRTCRHRLTIYTENPYFIHHGTAVRC